MANFVGTSGDDLLGPFPSPANIYGLAGNDTLTGGSGNDALNGGSGFDIMTGGLGSDVYTVDDPGDQVIENLGEGSDRVIFTPNLILFPGFTLYTLGNDVERLDMGGTADIGGIGNGLVNYLTGNSGNNSLSGAGANDYLFGNNGNDYLDGGAGTDALVGGLGDDSYVVDQKNDATTENPGEGVDRVYSTFQEYTLGNNVEQLYLLGTGDINGNGNSEDNYLEGNSGKNLLDGQAGADTMAGGAGADIYYIDNPLDAIVEAPSSDRNAAFFIPNLTSFPGFTSYTLPTNVQNLRILGSANLNGIGNSLSNFIEGNSGINTLNGEDGTDYLYGLSGNDFLDGGAGNDNLDGGLGADTYYTSLGTDTYIVDSTLDVVVGNTGGIHQVLAAVSYNLSTNAPGVRNLVLTGSGNTNATARDMDSTLTGNSGNNQLSGKAGNDSLYGNAGNDVLIGGGGNDSLSGQLGADRFRFAIAGTFSSLGVDTLGDFNSAQGDKVELSKGNFTALSGLAAGSALSGNEFATVTLDTLAGLSPALVVYSTGSGRLFYNPDGAVAGFGTGGQFARVTGIPALTPTDLIAVA